MKPGETLGRINREIVSCTKCPRLVTWREEAARLRPKRYADWEYWAKPVPGFGDSRAPVLIVQFSAERLGDYVKMAAALRATGIGVEVYPEAKKVGQQLQYAERRGFQVALIAGPDEFAQEVWKIKNLARREETTVAANEVVAAVCAQASSAKPPSL